MIDMIQLTGSYSKIYMYWLNKVKAEMERKGVKAEIRQTKKGYAVFRDTKCLERYHS